MTEFHALDVVTVTTGRLVSDRGIASVYEVCSHVLGDDSLMTHQLPAASEAATPSLVDQHPWLADLEPPDDLDELWAWCAAIVAEHGERLEITPAEDPQWVQGNALRDLSAMTSKPVIGVVMDDET